MYTNICPSIRSGTAKSIFHFFGFESAMLVQTFLTHELRQLQGSAVIGAIGCVSRVYVTSVT